MRVTLMLLILQALVACSANWIAPITPSTTTCDVDDTWSCPAPLTCIEGYCLRSDEARCGDGIVQSELGEECDDANGEPYDRCDNCSVTFCGDGVIQRQAGELCDDGNRQDTDGCTSNCVWSRCGDGIQRLDAAPGSSEHEACDDGNTEDRDECTNACETARCGDGWVLEDKEFCDDGNDIDEDACSNTCGLGLTSVVMGSTCGGCALTERGQVLCWGLGTSGGDCGAFGDLSTTPTQATHRPVLVPNLPPVEAITTDGAKVCAKKEDGAIWCWNGSSAPRHVHTIAPGLSMVLFDGDLLTYGNSRVLTRLSSGRQQNWVFDEGDFPVQIEAYAKQNGRKHLCIRTEQGRVYCMGDGAPGILGFDESETENWTLRALPLTNVVDLAISQDYNCALLANGQVTCWGTSSRFAYLRPGQFLTLDLRDIRKIWNGVGTHVTLYAQNQAGTIFEASQYRSQVIGTIDPVIDAAGSLMTTTCAITNKRRMWCWGYDEYGYNLPVGDVPIEAVPVRVKGIQTAQQVAVGNAHSCALLFDGSARCWGADWSGQRGSGADLQFNAPPSPVYGIEDAASITVLNRYGCVLNGAGRAICWGPFTQLESTDSPTLRFAEYSWLELQAGSDYLCGIAANQSIQCMGSNNAGTLGIGSAGHSAQPQPVIGLSRSQSLSTGPYHACSVGPHGEVACWGNNGLGRIDATTNDHFLEPRPIADLPPAEKVSVGISCACILSQDGEVICWGQPAGLGSCQPARDPRDPANHERRPIEGLSDRPIDITTGNGFACAQLIDGRVDCWGINLFGQLGNGTTSTTMSPHTVRDLPTIRSMDAQNHACAISTDHSVYCWGLNRYNQVGNGRGPIHDVPTLVPLY